MRVKKISKTINNVKLANRTITIGKEILIIVSVFTVLTFIDLTLAFFVATICITLVLTRRLIFQLNPLSSKEKEIAYEGNILSIPTRVEVFEIKDISSLESLLKYVNILQGITIPPRILIIRCCIVLSPEEFCFIEEVLKILDSGEIMAVFSDLDKTNTDDLRLFGLKGKTRETYVCDNITDALSYASGILNA